MKKQEEAKSIYKLKLKFRAYDQKKETIHYEVEATYEGCGGNPPVENNDTFYDLINDENYILEQCSGLKDKNGKLVYEGDVLKAPDHLEWLVIFYKGCFCGVLGERIEPLYDLLNYGLTVNGTCHVIKETK